MRGWPSQDRRKLTGVLRSSWVPVLGGSLLRSRCRGRSAILRISAPRRTIPRRDPRSGNSATPPSEMRCCGHFEPDGGEFGGCWRAWRRRGEPEPQRRGSHLARNGFSRSSDDYHFAGLCQIAGRKGGHRCQPLPAPATRERSSSVASTNGCGIY